MLAFGAGMDMLPFAHAGAEGVLGAAITAQLYGAFIFNILIPHNPESDAALTADDLVASQQNRAGLTKAILRAGCVFPNQAKFTYAGGPNFMVGVPGVNYRTLATLTSFYQGVIWPYLIANGTNPDSNPNVAQVRATTGGILAGILASPERQPIDVIGEVIPQVMRG